MRRERVGEYPALARCRGEANQSNELVGEGLGGGDDLLGRLVLSGREEVWEAGAARRGDGRLGARRVKAGTFTSPWAGSSCVLLLSARRRGEAAEGSIFSIVLFCSARAFDERGRKFGKAGSGWRYRNLPKRKKKKTSASGERSGEPMS